MRVHSMRDAWHDCVQNALVGLLEAMDRFEPHRGVIFQTYARYRVRGAVFNGLRTLRESMVQSIYFHDQNEIMRERLESFGSSDETEQDPLDAFVAATVGLGLGFLLENQSFPERHGPTDAYSELEKHELNASVMRSVQLLDDREQTIITLHYYHHVSFIEIANQLGLTKGRVSQLHKRALERLRRLLAKSSTADL